MFGIQEDGTYLISTDGAVTPYPATDGFIVAVDKLTDAAALVAGDVFGRWTDTETGEVFWDRVVRTPVLATALAIARTLGELAIWDLGRSEEIRIN